MPLPRIEYLLNRMNYPASLLVLTLKEKDRLEDTVKELDWNTACPMPHCRLAGAMQLKADHGLMLFTP